MASAMYYIRAKWAHNARHAQLPPNVALTAAVSTYVDRNILYLSLRSFRSVKAAV